MALALAATPVRFPQAQTPVAEFPSDGETTAQGELEPLTIFDMQSYGCLITGGVAAGMSPVINTNELLLLLGATVVPSTVLTATLAVAGVVFAGACAVGAVATPAVVRLYDYYYRGMRVAGTGPRIDHDLALSGAAPRQ